MSRVDLDKIQLQLRTAIQHHQKLVAKMKNDPQNNILQKQLHELQHEITTLSEKQKSIVQLLRKELVIRKSQTSPGPQPVSPQTIPQPPAAHTGIVIQPQSITPGLCLRQTTVTVNVVGTGPHSAVLLQPAPAHSTPPTHVITSPSPLPPHAVPQPAHSQLVQQQALPPASPHTVHGQQCPTPPSAVPILLNKSSSHQEEHSKQPRIHNNHGSKNINQARTSSPPIRVPQYSMHRPSILQGKKSTVIKPHVSSSPPVLSTRKHSDTDKEDIKRSSMERKQLSPEERQKLEFMASLDLITQETLKEIQSKRSERKRRTTANPQFSYANFGEPERKREASSASNGTLSHQTVQKRRGRPPKIATSPSHSRPQTPVTPVTPDKPRPAVANPGLLEPGDIHEDYCAVCHTTGELLMCDTCSLVYHLTCLEPRLTTIPKGMWSCPKCQASGKGNSHSAAALALVHEYITTKSVKEEECRKLKKHNQELAKEKLLLEQKAKQFNELLTKQAEQKNELCNSTKAAQQSVEKLKTFITAFQTSSSSS